jgi:Helicase associated domain
MMMMMMTNSHVILSVFLTAFATRNRGNMYGTSPPSIYHWQLGITSSSVVHHTHIHHPQEQLHYDYPYRLACLLAAANVTDTDPGQLSVVEEGRKAAARSNTTSSLKAEVNVDNSKTDNTFTMTTTGGPFMDRVQQLLDFRQKHGHCRVPKRHVENPALGNWVNKQRQEFKRFQSGQKPCALTPQRIQLLESIGMCWDASAPAIAITSHHLSSTSLSSTRADRHEDGIDNEQKESAWQKELQEVKHYMQVHNLASVTDLPRQSSWDVWIKRQREKYGKLLAFVSRRGQNDPGARAHHHQKTNPLGDNGTKMAMTPDAATIALGRVQQLSTLDCDWYLTRRQAAWECRFRELQTYYEKHGDCCVPISYQASPQLAHWVSNQRKLYNQYSRRRQKQQEQEEQNHHQQHQPPTSQQHHHNAGSTTTKINALTEERLSRIERLQSVGFVWNRWDYEFAKKR